MKKNCKTEKKRGRVNPCWGDKIIFAEKNNSRENACGLKAASVKLTEIQSLPKLGI